MRFTALTSLALSAILLGGCASSETDYPSLAIRDVERAEGEFEPVESAQIEVPPVEVNVTGDLASLVTQAEEAHLGFVWAVPAATRTAEAASGSTVASDGWAAAQVALADLDSARSQTAIALGELDILFIAASVENAERAAIETARNRVLEMIAEQDAVLERLRAQLR